MSTPTSQEIRQAIQDLNNTHEHFKGNFWQQAITNTQDTLTPTVTKKLQSMQLTHSEMQILSLISQAANQEMAYQTLVAQVSFSQGMLSRYVKKLALSDLISRFHKSENKKAVYVSVTDLGMVIARLHAEMHRLEDAANDDALRSFSPEQLTTTVAVLNALANAQQPK